MNIFFKFKLENIFQNTLTNQTIKAAESKFKPCDFKTHFQSAIKTRIRKAISMFQKPNNF